jgi:hypothetical protein
VAVAQAAQRRDGAGCAGADAGLDTGAETSRARRFFLRRDRQVRAAEDLERGAGDRGGVVGREEEHRLGDVARPELLRQRLGVLAGSLVLLVLDRAGLTALIATLWARNSRARLCVSPIRPNFAALCAATFASPRMPWIDATLTMRPLRRSAMRASAARQNAAAAVRFVAMTRSHSAGESWRNGRQTNTPALLTSTSSGPSSASVLATHSSGAPGRVMSSAIASAARPSSRICRAVSAT